MGFLVFILVVVLAVAAWKFRVPLMARVLGQSQSRVDRQLNKRRD